MSKTLDCGCIIFSAGSFKFCPTHTAAPAMLAALKAVLERFEGSRNHFDAGDNPAIMQAHLAIEETRNA